VRRYDLSERVREKFPVKVPWVCFSRWGDMSMTIDGGNRVTIYNFDA